MKTFFLTFISIDIAMLRIIDRKQLVFQGIVLLWLDGLAVAWYYSRERLFWNLFWGLIMVESMCYLIDFFGEQK